MLPFVLAVRTLARNFRMPSSPPANSPPSPPPPPPPPLPPPPSPSPSPPPSPPPTLLAQLEHLEEQLEDLEEEAANNIGQRTVAAAAALLLLVVVVLFAVRCCLRRRPPPKVQPTTKEEHRMRDREEERRIKASAVAKAPWYWPRTAPAALCVLVDCFGLVTIAPMLPYLLAEVDQLDDPDAWLGPIMSAQAAMGLVGHLVWGALSDRWGARPVLAIVMAGNAACFLATAYAVMPEHLIAVRALAGFFTPLVPATAFVLERAQGSELVAAFGTQAAAALSGSMMADAAVAFLYPSVGWSGVNTISAVAAALATLSLLSAVAPRPGGGAAEPPPAGGGSGCSGDVVLFLWTSVVMGWGLSLLVVLRPEALREVFGLTARQLGLLSMATTSAQTLFSFGGVPWLSSLLSHRQMLTVGVLGGIASAGALAVSTGVLVAHVAAYVGMMLSNLLGTIGNRAQLGEIAQRTGVGAGALSSLSRLAMTAGQALCPLTSYQLVETAGWPAPYALAAALLALLLPLHAAAGLRLSSEPPPAQML